MIEAETRYALWHGIVSIKSALATLEPESFLVEGRGNRVRDASGRWYLDARSNLWNVFLGYGDETLRRAIVDQLDRLPSGTIIRFEQPPQVTVDYANALVERLGPPFRAVKLYQTGSQAVEGAILLSRFLRRLEGAPERTGIAALRGGYHGSGAAAGAATGEPVLHEICGPLIPDVFHVDPPYCLRCPWQLRYPACGIRCARAIEEAILERGPERVTAVILEPIMGTGVIDPPAEYLRELEAICRRHGVFLIADEIATGFGRVGAMSRTGQVGVTPDMLLLGKGISNGYMPLSALVITDELYERLFDPGTRQGFPHGSTTDGHPLAAAVGLAVLERYEELGLLVHAGRVGSYLRERLEALRAVWPAIAEIRGQGLMLGVELAFEDGTPWPPEGLNELRKACEREGVLVNTTRHTLNLMPPLTLSLEEADELVAALEGALAAVSPLEEAAARA